MTAEFKLTAREQDTLDLLVEGNSEKDSCGAVKHIADTMVLSKYTVKTHLQRLYKKLGVNNQAEAVAVALATGLVPLDKVRIPPHVRLVSSTRGTLRTTADDVIIRQVLELDQGLPVMAAVRTVRALGRLGLLKDVS